MPNCCHEKQLVRSKITSQESEKYVAQIQYSVKLIHDFSTYITSSYPSYCQNGFSLPRFSWQTPCQRFGQAQAEELRQQQKRFEEAEVQVQNFDVLHVVPSALRGRLPNDWEWLVLGDHVVTTHECQLAVHFCFLFHCNLAKLNSPHRHGGRICCIGAASPEPQGTFSIATFGRRVPQNPPEKC